MIKSLLLAEVRGGRVYPDERVLVVGYALELIRLQLFVTLNDGLAVDIFRHYTPVSARFLTTLGQLFLPRGPSIHGRSPLDVSVVAWPSERSRQKSLPPFRLDLRSAAVNEQFDTRDETGVIRGQKQRHLGNFLGFPHAPHRDGGHNPRNHVRRLPTYQRRIDRTRTNNV